MSENITLRVLYQASSKESLRHAKSLTYSVSTSYDASLTDTLYKIYRDVYAEIGCGGNDWDSPARTVIMITPEADAFSDTIRYCGVVKAWLEFIDFNQRLDIMVIIESEKSYCSES